MALCGTKNVSSMASLEEPFEAPLFLRVYLKQTNVNLEAFLLYWLLYIYNTFIMKCPVSGAKSAFNLVRSNESESGNVLLCWLLYFHGLKIKCLVSGA